MNKNQNNKQSEKTLREIRKRAIKRDLIIGAAEKSFIELGYDQAAVEQIAYKVGYTKATIYNYFESKEDILAAVIAKIYSELYMEFASFFDLNKQSPKLRMIGDAYLNFVEQFPGKAKLIDSGQCVTINRTILDKQGQNQELTESELSFIKNEKKVAVLVNSIISKTLKNSVMIKRIEPIVLTKIFSSFMIVIRELVRRGTLGGHSIEDTRGILSILFNIIEQGVMNYNEN